MTDDFEDIPTKDIKVPTLQEVPMMVFMHAHTIRSLSKSFARAEVWFKRMVVAFVTGSLTMAASAATIVYSAGEHSAEQAHQGQEINSLDERVTYLERKNNGRYHRDREED